jgi:beta-glucosidase
MVKHFIGNNAETERTGYATGSGRSPAINTMVGERALQELYYPPFKAAVQRGGAGAVMGSYNRLNGTYACQHPGLLRTLKEEWGWDGFVAPTSCTPCATRSPPPTPASICQASP